MSPSDKEIIRLFRNNDQKGLKAAFDKYYLALCMYGQQLTGSLPIAEDVVQDIFIRCWQDQTILSVKTSVRSYLYTCVRNACINHLKSNPEKYHVNIEQLEIPAKDNLTGQEQLPSDKELEALQEAINKLPEKGKKVFTLVILDGHSYKDAALQLKLSVNTIKTHLCRAMQKLRNELKG